MPLTARPVPEIELGKYIDLASESAAGDHVFLVNRRVEERHGVSGKVGFPYFGQLILDCLNRTEHVMTQMHAFKAAGLSLLAQKQATVLGK